MVSGLRKSRVPSSDVDICTTQNCLDIQGTENFHDWPPADGLIHLNSQEAFNDSLSVRYPATHKGIGKKLNIPVFYWVIQKNSQSVVCTPKKELQKKHNFNAIIFPDSHGFLTLTQGHVGSLANCIYGQFPVVYHSFPQFPIVYCSFPQFPVLIIRFPIVSHSSPDGGIGVLSKAGKLLPFYKRHLVQCLLMYTHSQKKGNFTKVAFLLGKNVLLVIHSIE